ncbi:UBP19, partial [Symbiodinium necroappetens]
MWFCGTAQEVCDRVGCSRPQPVSDYDSLEVCDPQSDQHVNRESDLEASCFWPVLVSERGILDLNPAIPKDNVELWQSLQGMWYKQKDNICVGEICGASMLWHAQWKLPEKCTCLHLGPQAASFSFCPHRAFARLFCSGVGAPLLAAA